MNEKLITAFDSVNYAKTISEESQKLWQINRDICFKYLDTMSKLIINVNIINERDKI